ncbi:hypothetical protein B296_00035487 [Ensete ventricosum]|uniref:Uncharacterized protein n=1 Tax=Ensete ventricosum TaxID=4639 RepID=A0A426YXI3_ENSVE|nr:hypothetical protein B296_00035487 [Ensete ventricosum]
MRAYQQTGMYHLYQSSVRLVRIAHTRRYATKKWEKKKREKPVPSALLFLDSPAGMHCAYRSVPGTVPYQDELDMPVRIGMENLVLM